MDSEISSPQVTRSDAARPSLFPTWTVWRYIFREHVGPFFFAFLVIFFILILDLLLDIMDAILGKGLGVDIVLRMFAYNFAWMLALVVPMAVLVAVLMAFGRLANDNEITAFLAAGMSPVSLALPPLLASCLIAGALVWFNNAVLPESNFNARALMQAVQRRKPAFDLKDREGMFITDFPGHVLRVQKVHLDSPSPVGPITGSYLEGIQVWEYDEAERDPATIVTAKRGTMELWKGGAIVRLVLLDGEMIQIDAENRGRDLRTAFGVQTLIIADRGHGLDQDEWDTGDYRNDRELSNAAMIERVARFEEQIAAARERIATIEADSLATVEERRMRADVERQTIASVQRRVDQYLVEVHKKYSIPVACLIFVLVGAPLGMMARGAGRTGAVVASLVLFLLYWASLIGGENLADRGTVPPWLAMWGANILVGAMGIVLLIAVARNVRVAGLLEALPRALEARRERRRQREESAEPAP